MKLKRQNNDCIIKVCYSLSHGFNYLRSIIKEVDEIMSDSIDWMNEKFK